MLEVNKMKEEKKRSITEFINDLNLNDAQKIFIDKNSKLRTTKRFEEEALKLVGSPELIEDWVYAGYHDTGAFGNGRCSRGHALRYEHYARNKITDEVVIFGIKCVTDFFNLTPMQLKLIQQGVVETNNEIYEVLETLEKYGSFEAYEQARDLNNKLSLIKKQPKDITEINDFIAVKLPLPYRLERQISTIWNQEYSDREYAQFIKDHPEIRNLLVNAQVLSENVTFEFKHSKIWEKINDFVKYIKKYKKISDGQIALFTKLTSVDYDQIDVKINDITKLNGQYFIKTAKYNEAEMFESLTTQYEQWGLTQNQVNVIVKMHARLAKYIDQIEEAALSKIVE
jgi:hypothetical protein